MGYNIFCALVLVFPVFLFGLFLLLQHLGFCSSNPFVTGECELIALAPFGLVFTFPVATILFLLGLLFGSTPDKPDSSQGQNSNPEK